MCFECLRNIDWPTIAAFISAFATIYTAILLYRTLQQSLQNNKIGLGTIEFSVFDRRLESLKERMKNIKFDENFKHVLSAPRFSVPIVN